MPVAIVPADVEQWLGVDAGTLDATALARVIDATVAHAGRIYDLTDALDDTDTERDHALIMESARAFARKHSVNGYQGADELGAVAVRAFDVDVHRLLAGRLIVTGMFGATAETDAAADA